MEFVLLSFISRKCIGGGVKERGEWDVMAVKLNIFRVEWKVGWSS